MVANFTFANRLFTAVFYGILAASICAVPAFAESKRASAVAAAAPVAATADGSALVMQLIHDKLVDEGKGFIVEKKNNQLFIDGQQQPKAIAAKYLPLVSLATFRYQVYSFSQRLQMHPNTTILQMVAPVMFESPCVEKPSSKPGC